MNDKYVILLVDDQDSFDQMYRSALLDTGKESSKMQHIIFFSNQNKIRKAD